MKQLMVLLTDALGLVLMIAAPLLGWLPGPGGLPLFIAGLSLLALNHDWAKRLLDRIKHHAGTFTKRLLRKFPVEDILFWGIVAVVGLIGITTLVLTDSAERFLGFVYLLVAILLIVIRKDKA